MINDDYAVVCTVRSKEEAEEIVGSHNAMDPIKTWEDWLYYPSRKGFW